MITIILQNITTIINKQKKGMNFDKIIEQTFEIINRVRMHPREFIDKYRSHKDQYNGKIFRNSIKTREGPEAIKDLINQLEIRQPINQRLKWNYGLHIIADNKAEQLGMQGLLTTEGTSQHSTLLDRAKHYAIIKGKVSQVYQFGGQNGQDIVQWLLMDDGLASRKRRLTLLDPTFHYIGIGGCLHRDYGVVTVIVLAEDAISLVAANENGTLMKRQPKPQGLVKEIILQQSRVNQKTKKQKLQLGYSLVNNTNNLINNIPLRNSLKLGTFNQSNKSMRNRNTFIN